jgi:ribonuclease HI
LASKVIGVWSAPQFLSCKTGGRIEGHAAISRVLQLYRSQTRSTGGLLRFGGIKRELFGFDPHTTNNRMELMAPIQGLLALKEPCQVEITTDAEYVLQGITKWIMKWKRRHWWRKHGPIRNADLWMELDHLVSLHQTTWLWTRGHAGHEDNTRCD